MRNTHFMLFWFTFRLFIKDLLISLAFAISLLLNIVAGTLLYWQIKPRETPFVLHYTVYFGIDWIGRWHLLFTPVFAGFLILVFNFILAYILFNRQKILSYFFAVSNVFIEILILLQSITLLIMNS